LPVEFSAIVVLLLWVISSPWGCIDASDRVWVLYKME